MGVLAFIVSPIGKWILGIVGIALLLAGLYHHVWSNGYDDGASAIQAKWDADKQERLRAFSDMTTKWITAQVDGEKAGKERDEAHAQMATDAARRRAALPAAVADTRVSLVAGLLNDVFVPNPAAAPGPAAGTAAHPAAASPVADTSVGLWVDWSITMKDLYTACRNEVIGWQAFYQSLRDKQGNPEVKP